MSGRRRSRARRRAAALASGLAVLSVSSPAVAAASDVVTGGPPAHRAPAAVSGAAVDGGGGDAGRYIVRLRDPGPTGAGGPSLSTAEARREVEAQIEARVVGEVDQVLPAERPLALVELSPQEAASLAADPAVATVEADQPIQLQQWTTPPWGLDRVDQRALPLDGAHHRDTSGAGVLLYIVDSGVKADHADLAGRVAPGFSTVNDGHGTDDCNGHGTHVAGTAAGSRHGMAPGATVVPVRVFPCGSGATSSTWQLLHALHWVRTHRAGRPAVVNLSLAGGASDLLDEAVSALVDDGVPVVVAAGNGVNGSPVDACGVSPAREPRALTVGATTDRDARASYSNLGPCVDLFAPGHDVVSAGTASTTAQARMSGTSMAVPHVTGALARLLEVDPTATPGRLEQVLEATATRGVVTDARTGTPNLLLHLPARTPTAGPKPPSPDPGYWMLRRDGGLHAFGGANALPGAVGPAVSFDAAPGGGLWLLRSDGTVEARGTATDFGSVRPGRLVTGERVTTLSALPDGTGYWVFTDRGRVFPFGSARRLGDLGHLTLNGPIIASVATPSGGGYYLIGTDGGVFAFGDARFHGSMGASRLNRPIVGVAPAASGSGYWLVAADGGVFAFGVPFRGSVPGVLSAGQRLNQPVIGGLAYGDGYVMVAADGGAFVFSGAQFLGSLGATALPAPVVGLTVTR